MKAFILLLFIAFVFSCKSDNCNIKVDQQRLDKEILRLKKIDLEDPLGFIYIEIPYELNVYLQWYDPSDCPCCGSEYYRFFNKEFQQVIEFGWYTEKPDSLYQLTFRHNQVKCIDLPEEYKDSVQVLLDVRSEDLIKAATDDLLFFEKKTIDKLKFNIFAYELPSEYRIVDRQTKYKTTFILEALTVIKTKLISIKAECEAANCEGFIEKMRKAIESIRYCE